jgi:hypothetical protein
MLPLNTVNLPGLSVIQDFFAPFFIFLKASYARKHLRFSDGFTSQEFEYESEITIKLFNKTLKTSQINTHIHNHTFKSFKIMHAGKTIEATLIPEI